MSKIFRIYTQDGESTYENWNSSSSFPYDDTARQNIIDPDGATANKQITSIPSPFARIDLVKSAFREVNRLGLDGTTIFHKMVSDTLDVAEIFFNIDKYKGKINIIKWDPKLMLDELANSGIPGHIYMADALQKYMIADGATYNFNKLQSIYLLNYVNGPAPINIIGATSPATLFFCNANDLKYVNDVHFANDDKPFDKEYQPLYKRDFQFITYWWYLKVSINNFAGTFPEVDDYLESTFRKLNDNQKNELRNLNAQAQNPFAKIPVDANGANLVEVLGNHLYKKSNVANTKNSHFKIRTQKNLAISPLVLPVEEGNNEYSKLTYTNGLWGTNNKAPYYDKAPLAERQLPQEGAQAPYLTISDFLEDSIANVPYTLNKERYFNGNFDKDDQIFLLPIKPLFFEYFTVDELLGTMNDGKPMYEMKGLSSGGVEVTLRIPIVGNEEVSYIEYSRTYYTNNPADIAHNKGAVKSFFFTGFTMPIVKFNNEADAIYNIACVQPKRGELSFSFYKGDRKVSIKPSASRYEEGYSLAKSENYLIEGTNFDYIQVHDKSMQGILVPKFMEQRNTNTFEFAIDLGTSNTHIEYKENQNSIKAFDITDSDKQTCEFFIPKRDNDGYQIELHEETSLIARDFLPSVVGHADFAFPTRTVLSYSKHINWNNVVDPFMLANLPMTYDKRSNLDYNHYECNIKWGKNNELRKMEAYVNCLMLMLRNKVLLNHGDLNNTTIKWFYPISMAPNRQQKLRNTWNNAYNKYFGAGATVDMTESAAPIHYYFSAHAESTSLINVDIGGGTTDIAFAKDRIIQKVTSFRFASNNLFENTYAEFDNQNGIVDYYKDKIKAILDGKNNMNEVISIFGSPNNQKPSNMASFLFGLKDNSYVKRAGLNPSTIDFNSLLQDDEDFKIVFLVYYTAIVYHIAQIVKDQNLDLPRHIAFSGNGSKAIRVITSDSKILAKYTKIVFEKVTGRKFTEDLDILGLESNSSPKESTCKGGLVGNPVDDDSEKIIVFKSDASGIVTSADTYGSIDATYKNNTVKAVENFFDFVLNEMNREFSFDKNFGIETRSLNLAKEVANKDLSTFLDKGISLRMTETELDDVIEETFFFYPIKGVLHRLSKEIKNKLKVVE